MEPRESAQQRASAAAAPLVLTAEQAMALESLLHAYRQEAFAREPPTTERNARLWLTQAILGKLLERRPSPGGQRAFALTPEEQAGLKRILAWLREQQAGRDPWASWLAALATLERRLEGR